MGLPSPLNAATRTSAKAAGIGENCAKSGSCTAAPGGMIGHLAMDGDRDVW